MHRLLSSLPILTVVLLYLQPQARAGTVFIDFESLNDSDLVTNQFPGLTFSNTIVLSAGISLNEFEFPPHSGTNAVSDNGGPISIAFAIPILSFSGYFTYMEPLTLVGFDDLNNQVASAMSTVSSNDALLGDPGSSPNEFLQISAARGFSTVTITGDPLGGSFVMDDIAYTGASVPEPRSTFLFLSGAVTLFPLRRKPLLMRRTLLIAAAVLLGLFVIGGGWYLLARPVSRGESPLPSMTHSPTAQSIPTAPPAPTAAKPAATITPIVGTPSTMPSLITVNTPTVVTLTVRISPTPIANGVNLLRLGATGTTPTILGVMHDDGLNGDGVANDGIYTIRVQFNEADVGQIQLEASVAFAGSLKRYVSSPTDIAIGSPYTYGPANLSLIVPPNWTPLPVTTSATGVALSFATNTSPHPEYGGDVTLYLWSNPANLSINQFFDGTHGVENLFEDAAGPVTTVALAGRQATYFSQVVGIATKDVYVFQTSTGFIECDIAGNTSTALQMIASISF
jgi:hypothetical protein